MPNPQLRIRSICRIDLRTGDTIAWFIYYELAPHVEDGKSFCILDNASNNSTDVVHAALDTVFQGRWKHIDEYSPRLAPIERVYALVKSYIQEREHEGEQDPVGLINRAFWNYSTNGPEASSVAGLFGKYAENHRQWLADQHVLKKKWPRRP